jgi:hypothetical protein
VVGFLCHVRIYVAGVPKKAALEAISAVMTASVNPLTSINDRSEMAARASGMMIRPCVGTLSDETGQIGFAHSSAVGNRRFPQRAEAPTAQSDT